MVEEEDEEPEGQGRGTGSSCHLQMVQGDGCRMWTPHIKSKGREMGGREEGTEGSWKSITLPPYSRRRSNLEDPQRDDEEWEGERGPTLGVCCQGTEMGGAGLLPEQWHLMALGQDGFG